MALSFYTSVLMVGVERTGGYKIYHVRFSIEPSGCSDHFLCQILIKV